MLSGEVAMGSWQQTVVQGVFWTASILMVFLILRRPYLAVRLGSRRLRIQSYFLGALLGPVLILGAGLLS
jgi:hypothetical protein